MKRIRYNRLTINFITSLFIEEDAVFYCRENELTDLNRRYDEGNFECAIIYGRRRVGKTSLINEFCKGKPTVFFSALNASARENLEALSRAIYEKDHKNGANAPVYSSLDAAFSEITRMAENERLIFVIDEYPYLARADRSVSSRLQHIIDHIWQHGKLFLILCGSSVSFMENQVLGYESPLYGRRTAQYKIGALTYKEIKAFDPHLSNEGQALLYGITGGIPHYINKLNVKDSLDAALLENLFNTSGYLFEEPENLLKQELREPAIYNSIISAVAGGSSRLNEIAARVGLESGIATKYLRVLMDLGILKKETPITEKPGKKTVYAISDNYFRFWYRFVPKNMSAIVTGRIGQIYDQAIKQNYCEYMRLVFEQICRDYLLRYADDLPFIISDVGQWWGSDSRTKKEIQIDIVGIPLEGSEYLIGSCKYKKEKIDVDELELLKEYSKAFGKGASYRYCIFSKGGFTDGLIEAAKKEKVLLYTLEDIYK